MTYNPKAEEDGVCERHGASICEPCAFDRGFKAGLERAAEIAGQTTRFGTCGKIIAEEIRKEAK